MGLVMKATLLTLGAFTLACAPLGQVTGRAVGESEIPKYEEKRRLTVYSLANDAAATLARTPARELGARDVMLRDQPLTFLLYCRDRDGAPEGWGFSRPGSNVGADFGFFFDLDRNGRPDYLVFNGGPLITKDAELIWMNYHWIDSDADGRVDIVVYNDVDIDGDRFADSGWTAWVYDRDHDGAPDAAEYVSRSETVPIAEADGCFTVKRSLDQARFCRADREALKLMSWFLEQIQASTR